MARLKALFATATGLLTAVFCSALLSTSSVYATATASSITLGVDEHHLTASMVPGFFDLSDTASITVYTDNYTGYTLSVRAASANKLVSTNNDEIASMTGSPISQSTYATNDQYLGTFGFRPSQYVSGNTTVTNNTSFIPVPDSTGTVLDVTSVPNPSLANANEYTIGYGIRPAASQPAGTYTYEYIISAVGNEIVYNITYDSNLGGDSDTVGSMPSPNPQALTVDGGTPAADSYGTLSVASPTRATKTFAGWCDEATTTDQNNNQVCSGTTYQPGDNYAIDQTSSATNITLYAIWLSDTFPTVWSQMGKCVFTSTQTGSNPATYQGNVSGSECSEYAGDEYIDTRIALYSNDNYQKDYEVHFTMDVYNPAAQLESQATIFNDKLSSAVTASPYGGKSPGIVVRKTSSNSFEIKSTYGAPTDHVEDNIVIKTPHATAYNGTDVRIFRIDGIIYTSIDNGPLIQLQDYTSFNQQFGLNAWFGAYPDNANCTENCTAAKRFLTGELSNMYIKLGDMPASRLHTITFDADGGTPATTSYLIVDGDALGELPTVTRSGWMFGGWYTAQGGSGTEATTLTVPTANTTYHAYWYKSVTDAQITNTSVALSVSGTETITITNASDIEPYTLSSSDSSVATVSSAGVITGVSNGTATITMTGTKTGDTRTISVTVGSVIDVDFDSQGGSPATYREPVANGGSFASLPEPTRTGYTFDGWWTGTNGTGTQLTTSTVFDSNTPTQYYAKWTEKVYVCKIATVQHSEQCQRGSGGCYGANWKSPNPTLIEYGYLITDSSTVSAGAAYDCDVDNDGDHDPLNERFYYFGTENGNAKLIYYKNMSDNASVPYNDALALLPNYELDADNPSIPVWSNPNLVRHTTGDYAGKAARFMTYAEVTNGLYAGSNNHITPTDSVSTYLFEQSNFTVTTRTDGIWLERQTDGQGNITYVNRIQTSSRTLTHGAVGATSANASRPTIDVPTQYIEPYVPSTYTITFDPHNGDSTWDETVNAGDSLGAAYPANDPTYTNHIFKGWYTAQSGGSAISSLTQPSSDTTYHAQWRSMVNLAVFDNDHLTVVEGSTVAITITGPSDLEGHSFASNDPAIATVDSSTGVITGVAAGSTTITMTGTDSNHTRTIHIEVTAVPTTYRITFNPHNETASWDETIDIGDDLTDVYPANDPTYADHVFQGWFTAASGGTQISSSTMPSSTTTYHAQWKKTVALAVLGSNSLSVEEGDTGAIVVTNPAELEGYSFSSLNTSIATVDSSTGIVTGVAEGTTTVRMTGTTSGATKDIAITVTPTQTIATVCRLAVANSLHTGPNGDYGQIAENTTPQPGDAYDCDVNNDDNYNATNERFYYLGQDGNNNAVLVAWNSYYNGDWAPGTSGDDNFNYANAAAQLPSNAAGEWDHPGLIEQAAGKAARFTNYTEVVSACGNIDVTTSGALDACDYLMEHSAYDNGGRSALWLNYDGSTYHRIHAGSGNHLVGTADPTTSNNMVRPAIVVPYNLIEKYTVSQVTVTYDSMGGTTVGSETVTQGSALGNKYPSTNPTKTDNKFFGWYTDTTYNKEVTPETVVNSNVTYYARWIEDTSSFPIVWSEINECIFNNTSNISGTYCTQPTNISYVDTNVQLFTSTNNNYAKDFEVGFTITEYNVADQAQSQATLVNSKLEATGFPGFVVRRESGKDTFQLTAKFAGTTNSPIGSDSINLPAPESIHHVRIVRQNNKIYYAWNGGSLTEWWDLTGFSTRFDTEVWFGASANGSNNPWRGLVGRLTDMYVRLGTYQAPSTYTIQFNPNGGQITSGSASVDITPGDTIGSFPTVTRTNYTLVGWYDSSNNAVTTSTQPDHSQIYHAEWSYNSTKTPVTFDVSNAAVTGYDTIVKSYAPQITTFNEADPINNSTWGVAKSTYLGALQNNFETNNCMAVPQEDSQIDWGGNHTVNCSKPSAYDTGRSGGVDVYEYDIANDATIGTALAYTKSSGGVIHNLIPGKDYYWEDSSDNTIYGVISAVSSASDRRLLDVGNVWNVRDLGGLPVDTDGDNVVDGTIAYGKLIRGGRLNTTSSNITELQNLGIDKEYDLAGEGELSPDVQFGTGSYVNDEVIHYNFDYGTIVDNENTYNMARKAVTDIMNDVIGNAQQNIPSKNVYFHCRVGADRTGTIAYILEGLLGVPDEQRYQDYELTSVSGLNDRTRYYAQKSSSNNKKFLFMMGYLQTTGDIVDWYLKDTTDTGAQARIAAFKQAMVVSNASPSPAPAQQQSLSNNTPSLSLSNINTAEQTGDDSSDETDSNNISSSIDDNTVDSDNRDGYDEPLGVSKTAVASTNDATATAFASVAIASLATMGGVAYSISKHDEDE